MVTILNSLFAIFLSIVLITPIVLLIILLNKGKIPKGTDPSVIKKLEDIFTRIEALEEQSNITKVKGFKNEK